MANKGMIRLISLSVSLLIFLQLGIFLLTAYPDSFRATIGSILITFCFISAMILLYVGLTE